MFYKKIKAFRAFYNCAERFCISENRNRKNVSTKILYAARTSIFENFEKVRLNGARLSTRAKLRI